jgi:hypothetical protein
MAVFLPLAIMACSDTPTGPVSEIELRHPSNDVTVTQRIVIAVAAFDAARRRVDPPALQWSSEDESVASVDQGGVVSGHNVGTTRIRAVGPGVEASLKIRVRPAELHLSTATGRYVVLPGEKVMIGVKLTDEYGSPIPVPAHGLQWSTPDTGVVRITPVSPESLDVTAVAPGRAEIFGDLNGIRRSIVLAIPTVHPAESPFRSIAFTFVTYLGFAPSLHFAVVPGRSVDLLRLEIHLPGVEPSFPPLCSTTRLLPGTHDVLGTDNSRLSISWRYVPNPNVTGVAVLTYRSDDGAVATTAFTGGMTAWDLDYVPLGQVPWVPCPN